jgi:hypothetical protein
MIESDQLYGRLRRNPALTNNSIAFCSMQYEDSRSLFSPSTELSVPAPTTFNGSLLQVHEEFRTQPQQIPYDAHPSLSAAAVAEMTRNVELLSDL